MKYLIAAICLVIDFAAAPAASSSARNSALAAFPQHEYVQGEALTYDFEDTDSTFEGTLEDGVLQPTSLTKYEELRIPFSISIKKGDAGGKSKRVLRFSGGTYRGSGPVAFSSAPMVALSSAVPNFPEDFSYEYETDGQAVRAVTGRAYAPYMADPIGSFVYYKALDIHTIQSVIDGIPSTLYPGGLVIKPAVDIPLPAGSFHNGNTAIHYQRIEKIDGVPCAYFKVVTMANKFTQKPSDKTDAPPPLYTNYQYTFYVPLEGPDRGLLLKGELQETVTVPPKLVIQRQFSMVLRKHTGAR